MNRVLKFFFPESMKIRTLRKQVSKDVNKAFIEVRLITEPSKKSDVQDFLKHLIEVGEIDRRLEAEKVAKDAEFDERLKEFLKN